jgi:ATP-dependent Lon protease
MIKQISQMKKDQTENQNPTSQIFYTLPLRDLVIFPNMTSAILVGREKSLNSIQEARKSNLPIFVVTQIDPEFSNFDENTIYKIGTLCNITEVVKTSDGTLKIILQGLLRAKVKKIVESKHAFCCETEVFLDHPLPNKDDIAKNSQVISLIKACIENFTKYAAYDKKITDKIITSIPSISSPFEIIYLIVSHVGGSISKRQEILEESDLVKKLYKTLELVKSELEIFKTEERINKTIQEKFVKNQKDIYLAEQLKNIKKELGQDDDNEIEELENKLKKLNLPKDVAQKCQSEVKKLTKMNPYSAESGVIRNYLEWICNLPWSKKDRLNSDITKAEEILNKNHYALDKIKDRIIEFIAVQIKNKNSRGPILCLVGAPGVGKTSLAKSIAESLKRQYVKLSLGGVRDESEIRGHRRTYIGSMPGRIIQSIRKAKACNPLILLDEIDKMASDFRGDPAAALLEVLDPEQNASFCDHYLEVDYDLSSVMFVATANSVANIPIPLRDRMEIIRLSGYTENEKLNIAKNHLLSKQIKENGLKNTEFAISDEAILEIIRRYTFEAGVRNLDRELAKLARKATTEIVTKKNKSTKITKNNLRKYLGSEKFNFGKIKDQDAVGVVTGLAYTEYGGDLLNIEALKFEGNGKIQITGQLGDVMKESAQAAFSFARSMAKDLNIEAKKFNKYDFHIHVPEGATPKDGPSAGVAMCIALFSALSGKKIKKEIAMTGEITLTGKVLQIGGLKEKLLAALRGNIKTVLIPESNEKDLIEMPKEVLNNLQIKTIKTAEEAIKECLK